MDNTYFMKHGNALHVLPQIEAASIDAVITDPPYSSGGMYRADRIRPPSEKYQQNGSNRKSRKFAEFTGDNFDARSYLAWSTLWMEQARRVLRPGGYFLVFTDWRQLPTMTDALQFAGFTWRGIIVWDKGQGSRAPHKGYFRHQCEYIPWATNGGCAKAEHDGPFPGCIQVSNQIRDKLHMTEKPVSLMRELVRCVPPGGTILDPFAGSGSTGVAALQSGRDFIGIEQVPHYFDVAVRRLEKTAYPPETRQEWCAEEGNHG